MAVRADGHADRGEDYRTSTRTRTHTHTHGSRDVRSTGKAWCGVARTTAAATSRATLQTGIGESEKATWLSHFEKMTKPRSFLTLTDLSRLVARLVAAAVVRAPYMSMKKRSESEDGL